LLVYAVDAVPPRKPKTPPLPVVPVRLPVADVFTIKAIAAKLKRRYTEVARFLIQRGLESYRRDGLLWSAESERILKSRTASDRAPRGESHE
jgi:hypothetical protein